MLIKDIKKCDYRKVQDKTILCELLHPERENMELEMSFSISHACLGAGDASDPHYLEKSIELYYILEGKGMMHIGEEEETLRTGQVVYIPAGSLQWIENIGKGSLKFLCIVSPPWRAEEDKISP